MKKNTEHTYLKQSFILLDTNILIDAIKNPSAYQPLFDLFEENDCKALLDPNVRIEFLRGARTQNELKLHKDFLITIFGTESADLSVSVDIYEIARKLMWCAQLNENKHIKLPDALIGAQIYKYRTTHGNLLLATRNHVDFPPFLFERKSTINLFLANGSVNSVCIYDVTPDCESLIEDAPAI